LLADGFPELTTMESLHLGPPVAQSMQGVLEGHPQGEYKEVKPWDLHSRRGFMGVKKSTRLCLGLNENPAGLSYWRS